MCMRYIKVLVIVVFILSLGLFFVGKWKTGRQQNENGPMITADTDLLELSVSYETEELLKGIHAWDEEDGDLTGEIIINGFSQFVETGVCNVNYIVFDSGNRSATYKRLVKFTDYASPQIQLREPLVFLGDEKIIIEDKIRAIDLLAGDISDLIMISGNDTVSISYGAYDIAVSVTNGFGDTSSLTLPVHILPAGAEKLYVSQPLVYVKKGEEVDPSMWIKNIKDDQGNLVNEDMIVMESNVDINVPGTYEVHYTTEDAQTWLVVIVYE